MDNLSPGEQAEVAAYKAQLSAEIAAMDDVELGLLAKRVEIDTTQYPKREDLVAAIELKAEADFAEGKIRLRKMDEEEKERVAKEDVDRPATARIIRALNSEFCREIPQEVMSSGNFAPGDGDQRFGGEYAVANGTYRHVGSEWIFEIKGKRLVKAMHARPANKWGGDKVIVTE